MDLNLDKKSDSKYETLNKIQMKNLAYELEQSNVTLRQSGIVCPKLEHLDDTRLLMIGHGIHIMCQTEVPFLTFFAFF